MFYLFSAVMLSMSAGHDVSISSAGVVGSDSSSLLQKPVVSDQAAGGEFPEGPAPHVIGLRRESVPIYRMGKIASFKTSYSGVLSVGYPPQDFRVVFDTGSAHVILPAVECESEACQANNRRHYDQTASITSLPINADGSIVHEGDHGEQVTIGFGTGEITGEFAKDTVCFGKGQTHDELQYMADERRRQEEVAALIKQESLLIHDYQDPDAVLAPAGVELVADHSPMCVEMNIIVAVEMSTVPFKTFKFDGILGLSLDGLAMNKNFSTFDMLVRNGLAARPHFGVFLTDGEDVEPSEVAFGAADTRRMLEPLSWSSVYRPDLGYWVVPILAVRVDGVELDFCKDGTCRGVVDTGTSHLGVPGPHDKELQELLKVDAGDLLDCRLAKSPKLEIELEGKTIDLFASSYMRRLPLREDVSVSSDKGVTLDDEKTKKRQGRKKQAFHRPGYSLVQVGPNSAEGELCVRSSEPLRCPAEAANRREDIYGDKFVVYSKGDEICVNRTDQPGGWGLDLRFWCPDPATAEKEGPAEPGVEAIWLGPLKHGDRRCLNSFDLLACESTEQLDVEVTQRQVCVQRKAGGPEELEEVLKCALAKKDLQEVVIGENFAGESSKCVTPPVAVTCAADAGNHREDGFDDTFEIFPQGAKICAKRTDDQTAWGLHLVIRCKEKISEPEPLRAIDREEVHFQQGGGKPEEKEAEVTKTVKRYCSPRLMAVNLPRPLGPKLFILGEPVLHRYYTVYDWEQKRVGFSLANSQRNTMDLSVLGRGTLPKEVDMLLMQRQMQVRPPVRF